MLELIWSLALTGIAVLCSFLYSKGKNDALCVSGYVYSSVIMIALSWNIVGGKFYGWLNLNLPERGTVLHDLTILVLMSGALIGYVLLSGVAPLLVGKRLFQKITRLNVMAID